jgi:hypothetical protein
LKIILKKRGGKRLKAAIGLVVTKALSTITPPATQIISGKQMMGKKTLSSCPVDG